MEREKLSKIHINELITEINSYNLSLHKLTYRYGIDYIKFSSKFKEKYPEIVEVLSNYYIPRKVTIMVETSSDDVYTIECGNKYEINSFVGIPKCNRVVRDGVEYIEDLRWELLSDCDEDEVKEYKDKLTLRINVYGEYISKIDYLKNEIIRNVHKSDMYPYIIKGIMFGYKLINKPIELNLYKFPFSDLYYAKDPTKDATLGDDLNYTNVGMSLSYILEDILTNSEYNYSYYEINEVMDWFEDYLKNNHKFIDKKVLFGNQIKDINE
jgi:hypothetical protein